MSSALTLKPDHVNTATEYLFTKSAHLATLHEELQDTILYPLIVSLAVVPGLLTVKTSPALSPKQHNTLRDVVSAHRPQSAVEADNKVAVLDAMDFGKQLLAEFGAENMSLGFSPMEVSIVAGLYASVIGLIQVGSLKTALAAFDRVPPHPLVPAERKRRWSNRVRKYFGMPLI